MKNFLLSILLSIVYYFYRVYTAVLFPARPVCAKMFWLENDNNIVQKSTYMFLGSIIACISYFIFGLAVTVISISILILINLILFLILWKKNYSNK